MKTSKNYISIVLLTFFIAPLLFACASTPKQPLWDTQGIQRVFIMPFDVIGQSEGERERAKTNHTLTQDLFQRSGRFIIVDTADQADAIFRGELIDSARLRYADQSYYTEIVSYSLTRTSDGSIVGENAVYGDGLSFLKCLEQELGIR